MKKPDVRGQMSEVRKAFSVLLIWLIADLWPLISGASPVLNGLPGAWWTFEEGPGFLALDRMSGRNASVISATTWSNSLDGLGMAFSGVGYVEVGTNEAVNINGRSFSVLAWIKTAASNSAAYALPSTPAATNFYIISNSESNSTSGVGWGLHLLPDGKPRFWIGNGGAMAQAYTTTAASRINDGQWHHVAAVVTWNTRIDLYVDGVLVASSPNSISAINYAFYTAQTCRIGNSARRNGAGPEDRFAGMMDDVQVYSNALTAAAIGSIRHKRGQQ